MIHVMVDLETMGTKVGSAVTAIGAHAFDTDSKYTADFHSRASLASCVRAGLTLDPDTIVWWMGQSDAARKEVAAPDDHAHELKGVLCAFAAYLERVRTAQSSVPAKLLLWGNSAAFDLGLLGAAYDALGFAPPWKFWEERCYRTLKNLRPDVQPPAFVGTPHNALDDACNQAEHLRALLKAVKVAA